MNTLTPDVEKRLAQLKREVPTRGFERHPSIIRDLAELPPELRLPSDAAAELPQAFQIMIVFPPQIQRGRHYVPRQAMLFTPELVVHLLASIWPDEPPGVTFVEAGGLLYLKVTLLLLYGFLEIVGQGRDGLVRLGVEFNTVAWEKLSRPLRRLLQVARPGPALPGEATGATPSARSAWDKLPLKFSNGIRIHGLLPGEELQDLVFQPGVSERLLFLFHRAVLANTLVLLTTNFVAVIQEELKVSQGWIVSYIPRQNITGIQSWPGEHWDELRFQLERRDQSTDYILRLAPAAAQAWRELWTRLGGQWQDLPNQAKL